MVAALILALGAVAYGFGQRAGLAFDTTPLTVGVVVVAAGVVGRTRRLLPNGLVLAGWGAAVLANDHGLPQGRETPVYMIGIGLGLLAARLASRPDERGAWFGAAATTATFSGLAYYGAFVTPRLGQAGAWTVSLLAWALVEAVRSRIGPRTAPATAAA